MWSEEKLKKLEKRKIVIGQKKNLSIEIYAFKSIIR